MGKIKKCAAKESFERINYLYQAANALATQNESSNLAATQYGNLLIAVSKKSVQRLDVDMKRTICKGCRTLLMAGISCSVKIRKKQAHWTCLQCTTTKVFDLKCKDYQIWPQNEESLVETLDYRQN